MRVWPPLGFFLCVFKTLIYDASFVLVYLFIFFPLLNLFRFLAGKSRRLIQKMLSYCISFQGPTMAFQVCHLSV